MKAHIGVDAKSGLVHTVKTTTGKVHDAKMTDDLIRADDTIVLGDKGYVSDKRKPGRVLSSSQKRRNKKYGVVRAKVEYVFRVIKCQFGYRKVRYRGLFKNTAQMFSLMALANLYLARRSLREVSA
jgi:IS5 family transposase